MSAIELTLTGNAEYDRDDWRIFEFVSEDEQQHIIRVRKMTRDLTVIRFVRQGDFSEIPDGFRLMVDDTVSWEPFENKAWVIYWDGTYVLKYKEEVVLMIQHIKNEIITPLDKTICTTNPKPILQE